MNPSVTPTTMLFSSDRTRPWRERLSRSSSGRSTTISPSSWRTVMGAGTSRSRVPLGPFTVTWLPSMVTSTPEGTGIGARPMRDMVRLPYQT